MFAIGAALWPKLRAFQIYGANTNVGKTIASAILCKTSHERLKLKTHYLKPVSTGPKNEADNGHISKFCPGVETENVFQFSEPVSPHLAARIDGKIPKNGDVLQSTFQALSRAARNGHDVSFVETAGGVLSPGPSGDSQADIFRPLRFPVLLVGDYQLGGIATTISAYESLKVRGYDISGHIIFKEGRYANSEYLSDYFLERDIQTLSLSPPPARQQDFSADEEVMNLYYNDTSPGNSEEFLTRILSAQDGRLSSLQEMSHQAKGCIWYPFQQHRFLEEKSILVIDSAHGDNFDTLVKSPSSDQAHALQPTFDASASWWTQGLGHGNPHLSLAAAYAAGRYGHVMFAGAINEPALRLAQSLLQKHENPKLDKVFYTDNGSTGMEVAIKMALRASCHRYGWDHKKNDIDILGFKGSYHGDTMGVMDSSEPSTYNDKVEWYRPKGGKCDFASGALLIDKVWFDYPQIKMSNGIWALEIPDEFGIPLEVKFASLDQVFDKTRDNSKLQSQYEAHITSQLTSLRDQGRKFGALILEPVILGAGGMLFADPLFQRTFIETVRRNPSLINSTAPSPSIDEKEWSGLPIIFDEVFTGIHRLGRFNCNSFLHTKPDIVVNAKLLTGGLVPLCTTTASQQIFDAFLSDSKADALLHGHSYTAHAVGCQVAVETLKILEKLEQQDAKPGGIIHGSAYSVWSDQFLKQASSLSAVKEAWALGTVLAIKLKDERGGYVSTVADKLQQALLVDEQDLGRSIHSRVLGNVIYFMTSLTVHPGTVRELEMRLLEKIEETYR